MVPPCPHRLSSLPNTVAKMQKALLLLGPLLLISSVLFTLTNPALATLDSLMILEHVNPFRRPLHLLFPLLRYSLYEFIKMHDLLYEAS